MPGVFQTERMYYLLQHRALEELNIFVKVVALMPNDCPSAKASETPSILTPIAKLLQIFAVWTGIKILEDFAYVVLEYYLVYTQ